MKLPSLIRALRLLCLIGILLGSSSLPGANTLDLGEEGLWKITQDRELTDEHLQVEINSEGLTLRVNPLPPPATNYIHASFPCDWVVSGHDQLEIEVSAERQRAHYFTVHLKDRQGATYSAPLSRDPKQAGFPFSTAAQIVALPISDFKNEAGETLPNEAAIQSLGFVLCPDAPNAVSIRGAKWLSENGSEKPNPKTSSRAGSVVLEEQSASAPEPVPVITLQASFVGSTRYALFQPGETVRLRVGVQGWRQREESLLWEVRDDVGKEIVSGQIPVPAGDRPWSQVLALDPGRAGYFAVHLRLKNAEVTLPRAGSHPAGYVSFGVLPAIEKLPLQWIDDSRFGAQGTNFLESGKLGQGNPYRPLYPLLGYVWVYHNYRMFLREAQGPASFKPETDPNVWKRRTDEIAEVGLCPLVDLHGLPDWLVARPAGQPPGENPHRGQFYAPNDWQAFENYVRAVAAERSAVRKALFPRLKHNTYDIFWEPDWHWKGTDEEFIKMYEVAHRAIRASDPDGLLLGPNYGVLKKGNAHLQRLFEKGLGRYLDGITTHLYTIPHGWPEERGVPGQVRELVEMTRQYLPPNAKIVQTEWGPYYGGKSIHQSDHVLRKHLAQLMRSHLIALGEGIDCTWFYYTADLGIDVGDGIMFNLTAPNPGAGAIWVSPKPSAMGVSAMTRLLEGTRSLGPVRFLGDNLLAYQFDRDGQRLLALWSVDGQPREVKIPTGVDLVTHYDPMGNPRETACDKGFVTVSVDDVPIYLLGVDPLFYSESTLAGQPLSSTLPGEKVELAGLEHVSLVEAFHAGELLKLQPEKSTLTIPRNLAPGSWLISSGNAPWEKASKVWLLEVREPVAVSSKAGSADQLILQNRLREDVTGALRYRFGEKTVDGVNVELLTGESKTVTVPREVLNSISREIPLGVEFVDQAGCVSPGPVVFSQFITSFASRRVVSEDGRLADWRLEEFFTFDHPGDIRSGGDRWSGPDDLMFRIAFNHDSEFLYIALKVRDQSHFQTKNANEIWQEDSVQIGLAARPSNEGWQIVQKLGVALNSRNGQIILHREPHSSGLPGGSLDPERFRARVVREGEETRYFLAIPWKEIDSTLQGIPAKLGVGVYVNDADLEGATPSPRKVMEGFGEGMGFFQPERFGVLQLTGE